MRRNALPAIGIIGTTAAIAAVSLVALLRLRNSGTYARFKTMFGRARVYQIEDDAEGAVRLLEVGGIVQSGTYVDDERCFDLVFEYLKRYDLMFEGERDVHRVCVLGCGGYDYPEHLIAHHPEVVVDAVEIDPAITSIAQRYFFLDRLVEEHETERTGRLNLICADALDHLQSPGSLYDAIVNDCYDAGNPPAHLTTRAFAEAVRARLAPGGIYLANIVAAPAFLRDQAALLEAVFGNVTVHPCSGDYLTEPDNVVISACKQ